VRALIRGTLKVVAVLGGLLLVTGIVLRVFFADLAEIGHDGMAPTLEAGDGIFMWRDPVADQGDVMICAHPRNAGEYVLGRVIATGGMTVSAPRGSLTIDGRIVDMDWQGTETFVDNLTGRRATMRRAAVELASHSHDIYMRDGASLTLSSTTVPSGKVYLLGDNRSYASRDSRAFGPVLASSCIGQVFMRWRPSPGSQNQLGAALDLIL
jgi:signal peptidase I